MTPTETFGAVGAFGTAVVSLGGIVRWMLGISEMASQTKKDVDDLRDERDEINRRLKHAEDAAASIRELAGAVSHLGEINKIGLDNLSGRFDEHARLSAKSLDEIKKTQADQGGEIKTIQRSIARLN